MAHPEAASGITASTGTAGADITQTVEEGQSYIVTFIGTAGKIVLASITGVTSVAANIEWVFLANREYVIHIPIGETTLYFEGDESSKSIYLRKVADTDG